VRERGRRPSGRHDVVGYWTPPGGGIAPGETPEAGPTRAQREVVGLTRRAARCLFDVPNPSGRAASHALAVGEDEVPSRTTPRR